MAVVKTSFGQADGRPVDKYTLTGDGGLAVSIITYGAAIQELLYSGKDVVLGFPNIEGYINSNHSYQGATVGRYANRINNATFILSGKTYHVGFNEKGRGCLHGGIKGFESKIWDAEILSDGDEPSMIFRVLSPDGDEGFPGNLTVSVAFTVTADNTLRLAYDAATDAETAVSLTNHSYFNLNGFGGGDITDTELTVLADAVTPVDENMMPTGKIRPVEGTTFDFRKMKSLGRDYGNSDDPQLVIGNGYDVNYVLGDGGFRKIVEARSPKSGIRLEISTDAPGVQFYAGGTLNETNGKGGIPLYKKQGFCFEPQQFPDAMNQPNFPSPVLQPGEKYHTVTEYQFSHD